MQRRRVNQVGHSDQKAVEREVSEAVVSATAFTSYPAALDAFRKNKSLSRGAVCGILKGMGVVSERIDSGGVRLVRADAKVSL